MTRSITKHQPYKCSYSRCWVWIGKSRVIAAGAHAKVTSPLSISSLPTLRKFFHQPHPNLFMDPVVSCLVEDAMTEVIEITSEESFAKFTQTYPPSALVVLYFYAPWAQPCKQMSSVLEALASTYPVEDPPYVAFLSIDCEEHSSIAEDHDVTAVPYVVLQRAGKTLETISGSNATKVRRAVETHLSKPASSGLTLPPEQKVTKPAVDQTPAGPNTNSAPHASTNGTRTANDLSSYAPPDNAPQTAPETTAAVVDKEALFQRLEQLVKAAPVMLFMKGTPSNPQCGFSRQTVSLLRERSIRYGFFNILADDDVRQGLKEFSEWPTFPQLYVEGELVGGLDIVKEEIANNPEFLNEYSVNGQKTVESVATAEATA